MSPLMPDLPDVPFFSLEEANRTLPLVRRIVEDILDQYRTMEPGLTRFRTLSPQQRGTMPARELRADLERGAADLDELVGELRDLGCQFKGFQDGLVDWYSLYAGRPVFLCWKFGEPEIAWWHQVDAGFAGRQPILESQRDAFTGAP